MPDNNQDIGRQHMEQQQIRNNNNTEYFNDDNNDGIDHHDLNDNDNVNVNVNVDHNDNVNVDHHDLNDNVNVDHNDNVNGQDNHSVDNKISLLTEHIHNIHTRVHMILFVMIISIMLLYGLTIGTVNITKSYSLTQQQQQNTLIYSMNNNKFIMNEIFLRSSSLSMLDVQKSMLDVQKHLLDSQSQYSSTISIVLLQTLLIIFIMLVITIIFTLMIKQLHTIKQAYKLNIVRQEQYSLLIRLKHSLKKSQIKGFVEYIEGVVAMSVGQKVFQLDIIKEHNEHSGKQQSQQQSIQVQQLDEHIHYLQSIVNKLTIVQDVILLPQLQQQQQSSLASTSINQRKNIQQLQQQQLFHIQHQQQIQQQQQQQQLSSHKIIVIFSYPQIKQSLLEWFGKQKNRQKISSQIVQISDTPSPLDYMFEKIVVSNDSSNKTNINSSNSKANNTHSSYNQLLLLSILIQLLYIAILSTLIYLQQHPQSILPQYLHQSSSKYISYTLLLIQSLVMLLTSILYHQRLIYHILIKSIPQCITRSQQKKLQCIMMVLLLIANLLIVPLIAQFIVQMVKHNSWDINNIQLVIQNTIWGDCNYGYLIICYVLMKWVIYQPIVFVIDKIRNCRNQNNNHNLQKNQLQQQQQNINPYSTIYESTILFTLSILINPFICILFTIPYLIIKIRLFYQQSHIKLNNSLKYKTITCFVVFCQHNVLLLKKIMYLFVGLGLFVGNGLLLGYGYGTGFFNQHYCLIVNNVVSLLIIVFVAVFVQKVNIPTCFSNILPKFPIDKLTTPPIDTHNNSQQQQQQPYANNNNNQQNNNQYKHNYFPLPSISSSHRKQKQTANLLIKRIYTNQQFLFTYNQQMRKCIFFMKYSNIKNNASLNNLQHNNNNNNNNNNKLNSTQKITQELNTMSRSLQETLKQRLMSNCANPFQINTQHNINSNKYNKQDEQQFDQPYEIKVSMRHSKPKTVRIPMLNLQRSNNNKGQTIGENNNNNAVVDADVIRRKTTTIKESNDNGRQLKPNNQLKNRLRITRNQQQKQQRDSSGGDLEQCDILSSIDKQQQKRDNFNKKNNKNHNNIQEELYHKKIRFTDLFDSDQQSIKNIVKKKIKQSIPKITY